MANTIKMKMDLNVKEVTSDYVLGCIFQISVKSNNLEHAKIAKSIIVLASERGEKGLWSKDWQDYIKANNIKEHTYFQVIKRLKDAGILRKSLGKYYVIKNFNRHLEKMTIAMNRFFMDLGIEEEKEN